MKMRPTGSIQLLAYDSRGITYVTFLSASPPETSAGIISRAKFRIEKHYEAKTHYSVR